MRRAFVSHSSADDAFVAEMESFLRASGFDDVFNDVSAIQPDERFWPLYQAANDLDAVFFIHPTSPLGVEAMTEYWLMPLVGFLMDTTLAAAHLAPRWPAARGCG